MTIEKDFKDISWQVDANVFFSNNELNISILQPEYL